MPYNHALVFWEGVYFQGGKDALARAGRTQPSLTVPPPALCADLCWIACDWLIDTGSGLPQRLQLLVYGGRQRLGNERGCVA